MSVKVGAVQAVKVGAKVTAFSAKLFVGGAALGAKVGVKAAVLGDGYSTGVCACE